MTTEKSKIDGDNEYADMFETLLTTFSSEDAEISSWRFRMEDHRVHIKMNMN